MVANLFTINKVHYEVYGKKYKNVNQTYDGYSYDSKLEANHAYELDLLMKATDDEIRVEKWERQFKVDIRVNDIHICNHFIDFKVWYANECVELHECKGIWTPVAKLKLKLLEATYLKDHPEIEYRVIK